MTGHGHDQLWIVSNRKNTIQVLPRKFRSILDHTFASVLEVLLEADGSWWAPRTSNPVSGATSAWGGFDSHALPPLFLLMFFMTHKPCYSTVILPVSPLTST
jgi:hypothetical protein